MTTRAIKRLPSMDEQQAERLDRFRRTVQNGIARLQTDRDKSLDARLGRGTAQAIGGTTSSTDLLGTALRYEIRTVLIDVIADIYAAIQPASAREKAVAALIEAFREQVATRTKGAKTRAAKTFMTRLPR